MTFESPVENWVVLAALFAGLTALLGLAVIISHILQVRSGCLPFLLFVGVGLLSVFGFATYLNRGGQLVVGEVLSKREQLVYHLDGSWNRQIEARVQYTLPDTTVPITDTLSLEPARFDDMHQGDFVRLRCSEAPGLFRFTRLEDQSTRAQLWAIATARPFFFFLGLGLLLVLAARLISRAKFPLLFFLTAFVTIGAWWTTGVAIPLWQQIALQTTSLNTVTALVREIHRPYLGDDLRAWFSAKLLAPYDLILVDLTPFGRSERIMAIDVVDRASVNVLPGTSITVRYLPADPRIALVPDSGHRFLWKNGAIFTLLALLLLAAAAVVAFLLRQQLHETNDPNRRSRRRRRNRDRDASGQ
jgi:hypothetical protein